MNEHNKGLLTLVLAAIVWSTAGLFIKWLPQDALTIICVRAFYTMSVFFAVYRLQVFRFNWSTFWVALSYALLLVCFVSATKLTTAANAIFLQYTGVAYVLLLEPLLFKLPYKRINILTTTFCFLGMSLFFFDGIEISGGWGLAIAALSGVIYAAFMLAQRGNPHSHHVAGIFWGNFLAVLIGLPSFLAAGPATGTEHLMLAYLGIIQMGVGYLLFTYGLKRSNATEASLITMLEPLFNPLWVVIGYGERPSLLAIIGGLIIVAALVFRVLFLRRSSVDQSIS